MATQFTMQRSKWDSLLGHTRANAIRVCADEVDRPRGPRRHLITITLTSDGTPDGERYISSLTAQFAEPGFAAERDALAAEHARASREADAERRADDEMFARADERTARRYGL